MSTEGQQSAIAYLGLGSSLGDRWRHLQDALQRLEQIGTGVRVLAVSPVYESPHLGLDPEDAQRYPPHLNCVVQVETTLSPHALLDRALTVERAGGRQRTEKWGPRTIDIDILLYADLMLTADTLTVPHPGLTERAFVVLPLYDLAPELTLPDGRLLACVVRSDRICQQRIWRVNPPDVAVATAQRREAER